MSDIITRQRGTITLAPTMREHDCAVAAVNAARTSLTTTTAGVVLTVDLEQGEVVGVRAVRLGEDTSKALLVKFDLVTFEVEDE